MFNPLKKIEEHKEAKQKAREDFTAFQEIRDTKGFKVFINKIEQKLDNVISQFENNTQLSGEDLKRLQLASKVYKEVLRIQKELEENAK
uniref:Uncharacterized protein n=1 Tax=viral metagenome TaxID=1070528 RepID=A0A6H2A2U8_9ZZZZ